jgi:hypothetical protein
MITRSSAIYQRIAKSGELNENRAQVMISLLQYGMSIDDIAELINSSESMARSGLVRPFRPFDPHDANNPIHTIDTVHGPSFPRTTDPAAQAPSQALEETTAREQKKFAWYLAAEIHWWLGTFEATNAERQQAVEQARFRLGNSTFYMDGKFLFQTGDVVFEFIGVLKSLRSSADDRDFGKAAGRWLGAWIRFWIPDPDVWNPALDLAFTYFGEDERAA